MAEALLELWAFSSTAVGVAWLALSHERHWQQAHGSALPLGAARRLRGLGGFAALLGLLLDIHLNHATMAPLVWVMSLTTAALLVSFTLAFRPRWLALLTFRQRGSARSTCTPAR